MTTAPTREFESRRRTIVGNLALIAGRSFWVALVSYAILLGAGVTDLMTFHQAIELAIDQDEWILWTIVGGFTLIAILLSHMVGQFGHRSVRSRHAPGSRIIACSALAGWVALGAMSFLFRWNFTADAGPLTGPSGDVLPADPSVDEGHYTALLFVALFVGTGVVSAVAGYNKPSAAVGQYLRARRKLDKANEVRVELAEASTAADALARTVEESRRGHEADWQSMAQATIQLSKRLKDEFDARPRDHGPLGIDPTQPDSGGES